MFYTGLMMGSLLPEGLWPYDDDDPQGGVIPRYEAHLKKQGRGDHWIPNQAYESRLVGFWVALPPGCEGFGAAKLEGNCRWDLIPIKYEESIKRSKGLWGDLETWLVQTYGVRPTTPVLWMAVLEM